MKKILQKHVAENNVLLHGSPKKIDELSPRFADNEMVVCATSYPEIAIFMAIVGACKNGQSKYSVQYKRGGQTIIIFTLCKDRLQDLLTTDPVAFVYTIDAAHFNEISPVEHRTYDSVYVQDKFIVKKRDLPFIPLEHQNEYKVFIPHETHPSRLLN